MRPQRTGRGVRIAAQSVAASVTYIATVERRSKAEIAVSMVMRRDHHA